MARTELTEKIQIAEGLILQGQYESASELLAHLAEDVEEYVDRNCPTTDTLQWFSFPTIFERLAYRRVENDPRELRDIGEPLDRLYADLALSEVHLENYDTAIRALAQAIRWNPMGCESRLNLADLYHLAHDIQEYLALTFSVFERASHPRHLARAFVNFASWFESEHKNRCAAAALRAARRLDASDSTIAAALSEAQGSDHDPDLVNDDETRELLAQEGLPDGANAEIAICLLMCALDAANLGQRNLATRLTLRSQDLIGQDATMALLELIREQDTDVTNSIDCSHDDSKRGPVNGKLN